MEILQCIILIFAVYYVETKYINVDYQYDENAKVWLKLHRIKTTWHEARKMCNLEGAILASPLDELIKDSLDTYTKAHDINRIHIGIHSTFSSKIWHSIEGIPLQMLMDHLGVGQLENSHQLCGVLEDGVMMSGSCQDALPYICYKRDNSGQELTSCGTFDKGERLEDSGYSSWESGEPNNAGKSEYCGNVNRKGYLNDDPCYKECAFICEKDVRFTQNNTTTAPMPNEHHYTTKSPPINNLHMTKSQESDESPYTIISPASDNLYMITSQESDSLYTTTSQLDDILNYDYFANVNVVE